MRMADEVTKTRKGARAARKIAAALGAMAVLATPAAARAQAATFYLDRLFMAGAPDDGIGIWRPQMGEKTRFFGQLGLGFAYDPFRVANEIKDPMQRSIVNRDVGTPVRYQLITYADIGVEILDRFAFQVELPAAVVNKGAPANDN